MLVILQTGETTEGSAGGSGGRRDPLQGGTVSLQTVWEVWEPQTPVVLLEGFHDYSFVYQRGYFILLNSSVDK